MSPADSVIDVGDRDVLRVQFGRRMGKLYVDIRFWMLDQAKNDLAPTRRGIQVPAAHLPEIIDALKKVRAAMVRDGCLSDDDPPKFDDHAYLVDF